MQVVLPTSFYPSIDYMKQIHEADKTIIDIHENYVKQNLRNRCQIYSPNGKQDLIIPVIKGRSPKTPTCTLKIAYHEEWQIKAWRSIETAYRSSPYFEHYEDELKPLFEIQHEYLWELNKEVLDLIMMLIGMDSSKVCYSQTYVEGTEWEDKRILCAKKRPEMENPKSYIQVFQEKYGFIPNLSIIDLLFCEGPNALACL